jgi:large subunit ribosomal protein L15
MKLHDLRPAEGSRTERTRVGRGIAAGKGKTAGRGTKGQKARAGGSIPAWFEGGQTPLHVRIPKLRGFRNRGKVVYEIVNVGDIGAAVERGALETQAADVRGKSKASAQVTVNQDILRAVGLVRSLDKPLKILGAGELSAPLFVVADAFTASARTKIEAAGGTVSVLEIPTRPTRAIGVEDAAAAESASPTTPETSGAPAEIEVAPTPAVDEADAAGSAGKAPARPRRSKAKVETAGAVEATGTADSPEESTTAPEAEAATTPDDAATSGEDA